MRTATILLLLSSFAFADIIIVDIPAQTIETTEGVQFNIKASAKKKPQPVATVTGSIPNGATISGNVTWSATITNSTGPVEFLIDGVVKWTEGVAPYEYLGKQLGLDTKTLTNGSHVLLCRIPGASHTANVTVSNATTPPPSTSPPQGATLLSNFANGTDTNDDTAGIKNAIAAAAQTATKIVWVGENTEYRHNVRINVNGVTIMGAGPTSVVRATNVQDSALMLFGSKPGVVGIKRKVDVPTGQARLHAGWQYSIIAYEGATSYRIENVEIDGAGCSGCGAYAGRGTSTEPAIIRNVKVRNVLADGIHLTRGASFTIVENCSVEQCGDDCIAVVSYYDNPTTTTNVVFRNNVVGRNWWARGLTILGGEDCLLEGNTVNYSEAAGIYIASETSFNSKPTRRITVRNNTINYACNYNGNCRTNHPAIFVFSEATGKIVEDVRLEGNKINNPSRDGIKVGNRTNRTTLIGNQFSGIPSGYKTINVESGAQNVVIQ